MTPPTRLTLAQEKRLAAIADMVREYGYAFASRPDGPTAFTVAQQIVALVPDTDALAQENARLVEEIAILRRHMGEEEERAITVAREKDAENARLREALQAQLASCSNCTCSACRLAREALTPPSEPPREGDA